MLKLVDSTNATWNNLSPSPSSSQHTALIERPVRIAVIDTGADIDESVLELYDHRLVECRSWIGKDPAQLVEGATADAIGHGTHATSLVLSVTENTDCEIYVAQVFERDPEQKGLSAKDVESMTRAIARVGLQVTTSCVYLAKFLKAVEYSVKHWEVDIISLSFGTDQAVEDLEVVIDDYAPKVLFFAATSNRGGNEPGISWPARHGSVIGMFASDGHGNNYKQNPNPMENHYNFSMLGTAVSGLWPQALRSGDRYKIKSGTSCATPIAAGVAASILTLMRRQAALNLSKVPDDQREQAVRSAERLMKKLRQPAVMRRIFFEVGAKSDKREGYHYVAPWHFFEGSPEAAYKRIKDVVDAS